MSKPYDATLKALLETSPGDWPRFLGLKPSAVEVVDADVSTVTAATDKVLRVRARAGWRIQHYDFQAGPDAGVPSRVHGYNALLRERHVLPVQSVVVLLRREAHLATISGVYEETLPDETEPYLHFRYRVIRVWELDVETVLTSGIGLLPLAPIARVDRRALPGVIERIRDRLEAEAPEEKAELWTATQVLLGLRYDRSFIEQLTRGVMSMKESVTYQAIVEEGEQKGLVRGRAEGREEGREEGRVAEARRILVRVGTAHFLAAPSESEQAAIDAMNDVEKIESLAVGVLGCATWAELLTPPRPMRSPRRKKS